MPKYEINIFRYQLEISDISREHGGIKTIVTVDRDNLSKPFALAKKIKELLEKGDY